MGAAGTFVVRQPITQARLRAGLAVRLPFETQVTICDGRRVLDAVASHPLAEPQVPVGVTRFVSVVIAAPPLRAGDADELTSLGELADEDPREGRSIRLRDVPPAHEGHRYPASLDRLFGCAGHDRELEHSYRDRERLVGRDVVTAEQDREGSPTLSPAVRPSAGVARDLASDGAFY
jgi:hypothetical protein